MVFVLEGEAGIGCSFELVHAHGRLVRHGRVLLEVAVGELAVLLATTPVISRIDRLNLNHNGAKVPLGSEYVEVLRNDLWLQLLDVEDEDAAWELLVQSRAKAIGARWWHLRVTIEVEWDIGCIAALHSEEVDGNDALVVGVELHLQRVLEGIVWKLDLTKSDWLESRSIGDLPI